MHQAAPDRHGKSPQHDILLVEDNPGDARLIKELLIDELGRTAFSLRVAGSLSEALALIESHLPDVVVLDLSLPDSFGLATLYRIGAAASTLPVIVLTGNEDKELALSAVKAGAQDFLAKHDLSASLLTKTIQYAKERKHNEAVLRTSEARFRSLAELSSDWYWEQDAEGRIVYVSDGIAEASGIDPGSVVGRLWRDLPHADVATPWSKLQAMLASQKAFQDFVIRRWPGGGEASHLSISGVPVVEHGVFSGYRGLGKDVTARERAAEQLRGSEELFRKMMNTGRDAVVMLDPRGDILFLNQQALSLFGRGESELRGQPIASFLFEEPVASPRFAKEESQVKAILRADGASVFVVETRYPLTGAQGESAGTLAVLTDLTEHKEREERLRQLSAIAAAKSQVERESTAKSRFLATVSHDLRQPMHALGLFIGDMKNAELPPHARALVGHMEAALEATQSLLDSILIFSRLESGMVAPNIVVFPLEPMLNRIRAAFKGLAREKGLRFAVASSESFVCSDPALLERICFNLVSNALRYTDAGGVLLSCRRRQGKLLLEVWDTGLGIPAEHREAVFREFYRIERSHDKREGVGLGLAIVRSCAQLIGCDVELRSEPGRGSRFSLLVPFGEPNAYVADAASEGVDDAADGDFRGIRVLLIDDDPLVLEGTRNILQRWGCHVIAGASGPEAEARLERDALPLDLIVSDLRLDAGELGIDIIMRLRRRLRPNLPALLITGDTSLVTAREVRRHAIPLLYKPVAPGRLRAAMAALLPHIA